VLRCRTKRGMAMPMDGGDMTTRSDLIARARDLAPILRERARTSEQARQIPEETVTDLVSKGLTRICQPARFGGSEQSWDVLCEVSMELGKGCGSQAWVANVFAEHNCHVAQFSDQAQQDVWGDDPEALVSTSYAPSGKATQVKGGWRISGRYGFASGVHHTAWSILGAHLPIGQDGAHVHCFLLVPKEDRTILDTWKAAGLAGTGSADIEFKDVFVPEHRVLDGRLAARGESPGAAHNPAPVYRMPHLGFAQTALASVAVGIAKGAVQDFTEMLQTRRVRGRPLADVQGLQLRLAEASAEAESARLLVLATARENTAKLAAGEKLMLGDLARSRRNAAYGVKLAKQASQRLLEGVGGSGVYLDNDIQRAARDIQAASGHIALGWDLSATIYGRYAVGLDLEGVL